MCDVCETLTRVFPMKVVLIPLKVKKSRDSYLPFLEVISSCLYAIHLLWYHTVIQCCINTALWLFFRRIVLICCLWSWIFADGFVVSIFFGLFRFIQVIQSDDKNSDKTERSSSGYGPDGMFILMIIVHCIKVILIIRENVYKEQNNREYDGQTAHPSRM